MSTKIQVARTDEPQLRPNAIQLAPGQPVFNYNEVEPGLFFKLRNNELCKIGPVHVGSDAPNNAALGWQELSVGETWLDIGQGALPTFKIWSGKEWVIPASSGTLGGSLSAGEHLKGTSFDGSVSQTWDVIASSNNNPGQLIERDARGNFAAGTITASLNGTASSAFTANSADSCTTSVIAGQGLTGGGSLTSNRIIAIQLADDSLALSDNGLSLNTSSSSVAFWNLVGGVATYPGKAVSEETLGSDTANTLATKGYVDGKAAGSGFWAQSGSDIYSLGNGAVGIGTNSPTHKLTVETDGTDTAIQGWFANLGVTNSRGLTLYSPSADNTSDPFYYDTSNGYQWKTLGTDRLTIIKNGNVSIGPDDPEAKLTITPGNSPETSIGGRNIAYGANIISSSGRSGFLVRASNNFLQANDNAAFQYIYNFDDGIASDYKVFRTAKGATLSDVFWTSIDGNGYFAGAVGIGTDNPQAKLHVNGKVRATSFDLESLTALPA